MSNPTRWVNDPRLSSIAMAVVEYGDARERVGEALARGEWLAPHAEPVTAAFRRVIDAVEAYERGPGK